MKSVQCTGRRVAFCYPLATHRSEGKETGSGLAAGRSGLTAYLSGGNVKGAGQFIECPISGTEDVVFEKANGGLRHSRPGGEVVLLHEGSDCLM